MKPTIVVSGVSLVDFGPLAVYRDALASLVEVCGERYTIVALVHRKELIAIPGITYLEFPLIKRSWLRRLYFEYFHCHGISQELDPVLWIAMDNVTPRIISRHQVVYCHNPSPFYEFRWKEALLDPKFGVFTLLFQFLYGIFIKRNAAVIVQQEWIRRRFKERYGVENVIVANPNIDPVRIPRGLSPRSRGGKYRFVYPAFPRTFKNHELLLKAVSILEQEGVTGFELVITVDTASNRCGADLFRRYSGLASVVWLGSISRERVFELYADSDCLIFPSKLETWGLPLTEFQATGKPILAVDLPYAYETVGSYHQVKFFPSGDACLLAKLMLSASEGTLSWQSTIAAPICEPFAKDWSALWRLIGVQQS